MIEDVDRKEEEEKRGKERKRERKKREGGMKLGRKQVVHNGGTSATA